MHVTGCCSKAFDIDMSPLSFGADHLYHFISERFEGTSAPVQEQCLEWLQVCECILCVMHVRTVHWFVTSK